MVLTDEKLLRGTQPVSSVPGDEFMRTRPLDTLARTQAAGECDSPETRSSPHLQAQQLLNRFFPGSRLPEHGQADVETRQALQDFQRLRGLDPSGEPDVATLDELERAIAWQVHEEAALASEPEPLVAFLAPPHGPGSQPQIGVPPHLAHLALGSLTHVTLPPAERMTNDELQRRSADFSRRFDAESDPKVRRQYARQLLRMEAELARRIADAPRDVTELPVLDGVEWDAGSPNAGIVGDLHPFQNHDLWVSELAHGPQGIRRRPPVEETSEPTAGPMDDDSHTAQVTGRVLGRARGVSVDSVPVVPENDFEQGVGTAAGIGVGLVNVALQSVALAAGEAILMVSGTINTLENAGDVREARGEIRGLMMAAHLFDRRGQFDSSGRISRRTMERFIQGRYGQEIAADVVTGAGADGPRRVIAGRQRGIARVLRYANQVLQRLDSAYAELSAEDQAAVDLDELREKALAEFQRRTFLTIAPYAHEHEVAVD